MNVIILEDDHRLANYLSQALMPSGFNPIVVKDFEEFDSVLSTHANDEIIVIMDRMIGKHDSISKISKVKSNYKSSGIIILSSLDLPSEKAKCLDLGADDYLGKPFAVEEMVARIRKIQRNFLKTQEFQYLQMQNLRYDISAQQIYVNNKKIDLTKKEQQLLVLFMNHPGRVYSKSLILEKVWDINSNLESNVVEVTIKNLRRKLEENGAQVNIQVKRNIGYWIEE